VNGRLVELAALFLKLGVTAFGGPAAHIAMMQDEVVERRRWMTREEFVDLLGATNLIPGPNSTEMAIHVGHRRAGVPGLLVAGAAFIVPSMLLVGGLAWAYVRFGTRPAAGALMAGIKPVVIAIVVQALWRFRVAVKGVPHALVGVAAAAAAALGVHELVVLAAGGAALLVVEAVRRRAAVASLIVPLVPLAPSATIPAVGLLPLFLFFLKVGAVLFGSGYVLFAFLRADLVDRWHWLTDAQLLDAIAVGQLTPGPLSTTATFIGYVLGGVPSALVATAGIFLPAFVFVALSAPLVPRMRRSRWFGALLDGVNVASLALMAVVTAMLARGAIHGLGTAAIAAVSLVVLMATRLNSAWLIAAGALAGLLLPL
jgi:chromate transporter